tara:strand:+ start:1174 stop:1407 length:234 start_codon:yes stop_codon:yes gene_type:complete
MIKPHNFLTELNHFISYCNDFYNIETGIYKLTTLIEIERAIGEYLTEPKTIDVQFDSLDREKVREIIHRNVDNLTII